MVSRRVMIEGLVGMGMASSLPALAIRATEAADIESAVIDELVTANHILADLDIVDAFGHISRRHPTRQTHFLMSRARAPGLIETGDIMEFDAAGEPVDARGRKPYAERFIHAAIYTTRRDVNSVVHDHSEGVIPFSVSSEPLRPISHSGGPLGTAVPVWDIAARFGGDTNMLVARMDIAQDLARALGQGAALLMRGHGAVLAAPSIRVAVSIANALERQAHALTAARKLGGITYLSPGEVAQTARILDPSTPGDAIGRTWEYWCRRVGRPFTATGY